MEVEDKILLSKQHFSHYSFLFGNISLLPENWSLTNQYLLSCVLTFTFAIFFYFFTSALSYFIFYILKAQVFTPRRQQILHYQQQVLFDIKWSLINIIGQTPLVTAIKFGYPYFSKVQYQWNFTPSLIGFCLLHLIYDQFLTYWIHRLLHQPILYQYIHSIHHKSKAITPFSGFAFHPLDAFAQAVPVFTSCYFIPLPIDIILAHGIITSIWAISIHDNVNLIPFKGILYAGSHSIHHFPWGQNYNYGKITSICDRLYGSYCDPQNITGYGYKMNKSSEIFFDKINKVFEAIVPDNGKEKVEGQARKFVKKID